jgi:SAM-dependent methyltransferase
VSEPFRTVLLPGRHHVLTRFQADYLHALLAGQVTDTEGEPVAMAPDAVVVWAVTSANHRGTRRNPVPAARREAAIERFALAEGIESLVVGVVDVAPTDRFSELTVKTVAHETGGRRTPTPADTVVACSTAAVTAMYRALGYRVVPVEAGDAADPPRPWDVLELLVAGDETWRDLAHPATVSVLDRYGLVDAVRTICTDPVVGSDGGLTATREYRSYIAAFEAAADRKWAQARPWVRPGRIVDVGCATGAMLELAAAEPSLHESDLFGVEVARHLYDECEHRRAQGAFAANPNTFFVHANVLAGPVFPPGTVDTTTTFALTHEILSYGDGVPSLERLAREIAEQTAPGGVWINFDVCGPAGGDRRVRLRLRTDDGVRGTGPVDLTTHPDPQAHLDGLSTRARFDQFAVDFRANAGVPFRYDEDGDDVLLSLADAMEFLTKRSYTDNWLSETHERFCALDGDAWARLVTAAGFEVDPRSGPWRNEWLVQNVLAPVAQLLDPGTGEQLDWPDTHILLVARLPESP